MNQSGYWKLFECTGQIDDYLQYKQQDNEGADTSKEKNDADYDNGTSASRNQNR